ncbi:MAG: electron transport complex subunit RsxC, partial [Arsenophonus sp. ER-BJ3-MAG3]
MLKNSELINAGLQAIDGNKLRPKQKVAFINENNCIGCTKCIQSCPVDAIVGTKQAIHTIIKNICIGCNLCVTICPTDSISMLPIKNIIKTKKFDTSTIAVKNTITTSNSTLMITFTNEKNNKKIFNFLKKINLIKKKSLFFNYIYHSKIKKHPNKVCLSTLPLANELNIPIQQHIGSIDDIIVKPGEYVLKGQTLTKGHNFNIPVHATTSGIITSIMTHVTAYSSNLKDVYIKLKPDNKDQWYKKKPLHNYSQYSNKTLISHIKQSGIQILYNEDSFDLTKLKNSKKIINTLIINAIEYEPYITANELLIQNHFNEIIEGILILVHILRSKEVLITIEDNKQEAIISIKKSLLNLNQKSLIKLRVIPTKYFLGGTKQLIKILTGNEIPNDVHPSFIGILIENISTVYAIKRAIIDGEPLIERVITLTGNAIKKPVNYWVRFGTPLNFLLEKVGIILKSKQITITDGPLNGFILPDLTTPIVKISNCILVSELTKIDEYSIEKTCICCDNCIQVCPANLLPKQLYWFSKGHDHEKAEKYNLFNCIECGACVYVCPSNIPLVKYYRQEKAEIKAIFNEKKRTYDAKNRFEAKKTRIEKEKNLRQQNHINKDDIEIETKNKSTISIELIQINSEKNQNKNYEINTFNDMNTIEDSKFKKAKVQIIKTDKKLIEDKSEIIKIKKTIKEEEANLRKVYVAAAISR